MACRARCERPRRRAAEQRDELSTFHICVHSMTSSAMASSVGGTVRPRHKRACYSLIVRTTLEVGRLSLAGPFTCLRFASS
jgi:hypothetical protein